MRKPLTWTIPVLIMVCLTGCYKDPIASFTMSSNSINVDESIKFTNTSADMERCEWIFGDGGQSIETNPTYTYETPGEYEVTLRVFGEKDMHADFTSKNVTVTQPTTLWVNVVDYDGGAAIQDCYVWLFDSYDDWYSMQAANLLANETTTNSNGRAEIVGLGTTGLIYINVYKKINDTYFYCNWFIQYSSNTYKTYIQANKINEVSIRARRGLSSLEEAVLMTE
ncbi:PKD domain-containing protein [Bacteroidota bacterium]